MSNYDKVLEVKYHDLEELSIKQEVLDFFTGEDFGEEKTTIYIARKIKRDRQEHPKHCHCWDSVRNEGKLGCPTCDGMGFYWNEQPFIGYVTFVQNRKMVESLFYKEEMARQNLTNYLLITKFDIQLGEYDRVYLPKLTDEGFIDQPITYLEEYMVNLRNRFRLDEGRIEYNFYNLIKVR